MPSDSELLEIFVRDRSDSAFGQIVARYSNLVFAAAQRQVRNPEIAQDVAQAAFLVLARKAASVRGDRLPAWLLTTARLCALDAIKKKTRRDHYEREAAMARSEIYQPSESPDPQIAALLDQAITSLHPRDCSALALRYLSDKPLGEVAAAIGVTPNAAQKIIARSLAKLRKILTSKGIILPSAAILAAALLQETAHAAPAEFAVSLSSSNAASMSIAREVSKMIFWTKIKVAAVALVAITLAGGTGSLVILRALAQTPATVAAATPLPSPSAPTVTTSVPATAPTPQAIASTSMPFPSPFLDLVGCRQRQTLSLNLKPNNSTPTNVTWIAQQYSEVKWTLDPELAARTIGFNITISSLNDLNTSWTFPADKSATSQSLVDKLTKPGEYEVEISAIGADSKSIASADASVIVKPMPLRTIVIYDIHPDTTVSGIGVVQYMNSTSKPMKSGNSSSPDFLHLDKLTDDQGRLLHYTTQHVKNSQPAQYPVIDPTRGNWDLYHYTLVDPVPPGSPLLFAAIGTATGLIKQPSPSVYQYSIDLASGSNTPYTRVELYRLPPNAQLISSSNKFATQVVDGQLQLFQEYFIPPGSHYLTSFSYKLPQTH